MILQACPRCSRQFDVTHLPPGSHVRCACDERFDVAWRRPFTIERLQCGTCGGGVTREEPACSFCGAPLPEEQRRHDSLCPGCFARIREDARHCHACGLEIRPQALTPIPAGRDCPRCQGELRVRILDRGSVVECSACEGLWVGALEFERICHDARAAGARAERQPRPLARVERSLDPVQYIPCLTCGELMFRRHFRYADRPSGVIVDSCKDHGVWLDRDELEHLVAFLETAHTLPASPAPIARPSFPGLERSRPKPRTPLGAALSFLGDLLFDDLLFD